MKYLSVDIETSSLNPKDGVILSFAAVLEDTENIIPIKDLPSFYCVFKHSKIPGEPFALNMNRELIEIIAKGKDKNLLDPNDFNTHFNNFLAENKLDCHETGYSVVKNEEPSPVWMSTLPSTKVKPISLKGAGKNLSGFDIPWIKQHIPNFNTYFKFQHRVLDVGSVLVDFKNDEWIPNLLECKKRSNVVGEVTHNALTDCEDVIECLRTKY